MYFLSIFGSFLLLAAAQPDISPAACVLASIFGFGWFWWALLNINSKRTKFLISLVWFGGIQAIHLNWLLADRYVGKEIYVFVFLASLILGVFFALFTLLIKRKITYPFMLFLSSLWTLSEWGRLFLFSGYTWDPVGLELSGTLYGMQIATIGGVFGLTFLVILTNLVAFKLFSQKIKRVPLMQLFSLALLPYAFGFFHITYHDYNQKKKPSDPLNVVLVQTALSPEEKCALTGIPGSSIEPLEQWKRILTLLKNHQEKPIDLIVLSEAVVPYGTDIALFTFGDVSDVFYDLFHVELDYDKKAPAGNSTFAHLVANYFDADVLIGLEDYDGDPIKAYNAAHFFQPHEEVRKSYAKRVLLPLSEYIPFEWCKKYLAKWGIQDSFTPGTNAKVFSGKSGAIGVSICYEETFGHLMRENKLQGANVLANLTNDVWYPNSRLPAVHYVHGRLRAVELGIPLLRSCNTGITCGVDSLGRIVDQLDYEDKSSKATSGALFVQLPTYTYSTPYTLWGDTGIVALSLCCLFFGLPRKNNKKTG